MEICLSESGLGCTLGLGTPKPLAGYGTECKVNVDVDLEPDSYDVVMDSSCGMQTVPTDLVDADVAHARSMPAHQHLTNWQGGRMGRGKNLSLIHI